MDALDIVLAVEQGESNFSEEEIIEGLSEHRDTLRTLQGSWGRFIEQLEDRGVI